MARRFETILRVRPRDNLGDPEYWNRRFEDIDRRIDRNETSLTDLDQVANRVEGVALDRLNQVLTPIVVETIERVRQIPNMFSATSSTSVLNGIGERTFVINEGLRNTFAHQGYIMAMPRDGTKMGMMGRVKSYNPVDGYLLVDIEIFWGEADAIRESWDITAAIPPDAHMLNEDNPHNTTAHQVGAYTQQEVTTLLAQLKSEILNGASSALDTLKEVEDRVNTMDVALRKYAKKQAIVFG